MFVKVIIFSLIILLCFRFGFFYLFPLQLSDNQHIAFTATLFEDPKIVGNNQEFSVRLGNFWQSTVVHITAPLESVYTYGESVRIIGTLKVKSLKNKQAYFAIQNPKIEAENQGFLSIFGTLRGKITEFCENNFSQPYSGLLVGIIFGIKSDLTNRITTSFRITGVSHIVSASGMNVTLVTGFLFILLGSLLRRRVAIVVSIVGILAYVALSGFDASLVRAALMGSLAFSATLFGRQYSSLYVLFLVSAGMLLWDPLLLSNVGFQLSVLATWGILVLKPFFTGHNFLGEDFGTTLAAQAATLPILLSVFGQYSLLSIIVNILVLWTIPLITIVGAIGMLFGLVVPPLGIFIIWLVIPLLWYMTEVVDFFSSHALLVHVASFPLAFVIGYYFLLAALILFLPQRKQSIDKT